MIQPTFDSADEALTALCVKLVQDGHEVSPRGLRTLEIVPCTFTLSNPRARRIGNPHRHWNEALAAGELSWHLSGSHDLDVIAYYAKAWRDFSADGRTIRGSCYGWKIFHRDPAKSQWERVRDELLADKGSRRAVLSMTDLHEDLRPSTKDVPCLTAVQFLIREERLDAIAFMRSNDLIWGLGYDLYFLTVLQELMAAELGVGLGSYTHVASSMHVYEKHWEMVRRIADLPPVHVEQMAPLRRPDEMDAFLEREDALRRGRRATAPRLDSFWEQLLEPLRELSERRHGAGARSIVTEEVV